MAQIICIIQHIETAALWTEQLYHPAYKDISLIAQCNCINLHIGIAALWHTLNSMIRHIGTAAVRGKMIIMSFIFIQ
jgi:hypothetical protein